jgi:hypothetical protein
MRRRGDSGNPLKKAERMQPSRKRAQEVVKVLEKELFHVEAILLKAALIEITDEKLSEMITNVVAYYNKKRA